VLHAEAHLSRHKLLATLEWTHASTPAFFVRAVLVAALVCSGLFGGGALAMWEKMSDAELLQRSDLIVVGTWQGLALPPSGSAAVTPTVGVVAVSEVLKGPATTTRALVVVPAPDAPRSSNDLYYRVGDTGLWLLRKRPGEQANLYLADHPQRFVPAATEAARIEVLRKMLLRR
jgi:hypothetical protein